MLAFLGSWSARCLRRAGGVTQEPSPVSKEGPSRMKTAFRHQGNRATPSCFLLAPIAGLMLIGALSPPAARGSEWANLSAGSEEKGLRAVAVDPMNPQRVFIGSAKGIFTSGDGGKVWVNCLDLSSARRAVPAGIGAAQKAVAPG